MRTIKFGKPMLDEREKNAVLDVLSGDILVHGPRAKEFEKHFAAFTNAPHAISVSSCTAALHLSYFHLGIGPGDEVIAPAQSHVATVHAIEFVGATPVFVDAEFNTGNIDIEQIEQAITPKTKAITVVHFLGMPVAMDQIMAIANKHNLYVIEDCALAVGAYYQGKHMGLFGHTGSFSFYPVKHFTTAEGGMLIANDPDIAEGITRKKAFGLDRTVDERKVPGVYDVNMLGFNYRMNEIQAAIGSEQMLKLPDFLEARKRNYEALENGLREIDELHLFQSSHGDFQSSYYCLSAVLKPELHELRYEIAKFLNDHGIGTSVYYPEAIPEFTYYRNKYDIPLNTYPTARAISKGSISLPVGPHLNEEDMAYITEHMKLAIAKYSISQV